MTLEAGLSLLSLAGILFLAVPVWQLNHMKKLLQRLKTLNGAQKGEASSFSDELGKIVQEKIEDEVAEWKWWHEGCLWAGYGCLVLSGLIRFIHALQAT